MPRVPGADRTRIRTITTIIGKPTIMFARLHRGGTFPAWMAQ